MELLENPRVGLFERIEAPFCEGLVRLVHARQRDPRGLFVIEQRIVEIEQHGPGGASWLHILIIETAGLGCMVN